MSRSARTSRGGRVSARSISFSAPRGRHAKPATLPRVALGLACSTTLATVGATTVATVATVAATSSTPAAASTLGEQIVGYAAQFTGRPYVYGASGPNSFDCSGYTMYVYAKFGVRLPHSSAQQYATTPRIAASAKAPGDLLFFKTGGTVTHVGIYAGGNDMYAAPHSGDVVKRQPIYAAYEVGRPIASSAVAAVPPPPPVPAPKRDTYVVMPEGTGTGRTELHGLMQSSGYKAWTGHAATALGNVSSQDWRFMVGPYAGSGRPDLFAVNLRGASGRVEVHVLSAASGYTAFSAHIATAMGALPTSLGADLSLTSFAGDVRSNLAVVLKSGTGSGRVEAHVLSAASGYSSFLQQVTTPQPAGSASDWTWVAGDTKGSGDLVAVQHGGTASGRTEVHVLSRTSGYQTWVHHMATASGVTDPKNATWSLGDPDGDAQVDLVQVATRGTGSGTTEVHALGGRTGYASFTVHAATALNTTGTSARQLTFG